MDGPGSSGNAGTGSHPAATDAAECHAGQVDGPGRSGNAGTGSHLEEVKAAESSAGHVGGPGSSGNAGTGSHLEVASVTDAAGVHVSGPGSSEFAENGSHPAAADFSDEPEAVLWRRPPHRAVQNQAFCRTECHRKTVPHRIRPPAVRDTFAERFGATEAVTWRVVDKYLIMSRIMIYPVWFC